MSDTPAPLPPVASPCTGVCRIDPASGYCIGCWRTLDEIARWAAADALTQQFILAQLPVRASAKRQ